MVYEQFNLLRNMDLSNDNLVDIYNYKLTEVIDVAKKNYDLTDDRFKSIRKDEITRNGRVDGKLSGFNLCTCVQGSHSLKKDKLYLIQVAIFGEILFSEHYDKVPSKDEFIGELESLYVE